MARSHRKTKTRAVAHASRNRHLHGVPQLLEPGALARRARFGPRFAAASAATAGALYGDVERHRRAGGGFASVQLDRGAEGRWTFIGEERAPHPFDGRRGGRKVDRDLVGEPVRILPKIYPRHHSDVLAA